MSEDDNKHYFYGKKEQRLDDCTIKYLYLKINLHNCINNKSLGAK